MSTADLTTALSGLVKAPKTFGTGLTHAVLLRFSRLCLMLFTLIGQRVHDIADPRLVLAQARIVEAMSQQVHTQRLTSALDAEVTGAHALSLATLDALDDEDYDFAGEPQRTTGRTCYQDAANLLAAWWHISTFEATRLIADAHLLIGRRTMSGDLCPPRFARLAALYQNQATDRRALTAVARQLNALEPADTTFDGVPTQLTARDAFGVLLEERAANLLASQTLTEARTAINAMVREYKDAHDTSAPPELGIFPRGVKKGVYQFLMNTNAAQAEGIESMRAQAAKRKAARNAARQAAQQPGNSSKDSAEETATGTSQNGSSVKENSHSDSTSEVPEWLRSNEPKPDWATAEDKTADDTEAEPQDTEHTENASPETDKFNDSHEDLKQDDLEQAELDLDEADENPGEADPEDSEDSELPPPRRWLNAVMNKLLLDSNLNGTVTPKVIVKMTLAQLIELANLHGVSTQTAKTYGRTLTGKPLNATELRQLLAQAQIIPVVLGGNGQPLDVGRSRRFPTTAMRYALIARDGGCIVPGCTVSPQRTEADHYLLPWAEGGETSTSNLVLECPGDHVKRHLEQIRIVDVDGLPHVILPEHLDPLQTPRRNTLWEAEQLPPPDG